MVFELATRAQARVALFAASRRYLYDGNVTLIDVPSDVVSDAGDSGSFWLDHASRACVALHFAGGNDPERALGMEIDPVPDALGVDLA